MTAAPIHNDTSSICSMFKFLKYKPWCFDEYMEEFKIDLNNPQESLSHILSPIILRRPINVRNKELSEVKFIVKSIDMSMLERKIYLKLEEMNDYSPKISKYLITLRLRQFCDHISLLPFYEDLLSEPSTEEAIKKIFSLETKSQNTLNTENSDLNNLQKEKSSKTNNVETCEMCNGRLDSDAKCGHCFQNDSYELYDQNKCSTSDKIVELSKINSDQLKDPNNQIYKKGSKLDSAIEEIKRIQIEAKKLVLFSQFVKMLDIFSQRFEFEKINFERVDGTLNSKQKEAGIKNFRDNPDITVLLITYN